MERTIVLNEHCKRKTLFLKRMARGNHLIWVNNAKAKQTASLLTKIQRTVVLLVCSTLDNIQSRRFLLLTARQFSFKLLLKGIRNLHWGNDKVAFVGDSRIKTQIIQNPITQTPIAMKDIQQAIILSTLNIRVVVYQQ